VQPQQNKPRESHLQTHYDPDVIQSNYKTTFMPHKVQKLTTNAQKSMYEPSKKPF
jgi:hypothetical protein